MDSTDILVIGGGPSGAVAAITARKNNPDKRITVVRKNEKGVIPCGIPYLFSRLDSVEADQMSDETYKTNNIELRIGEVTRIVSDEKRVELHSGGSLSYDKLILAGGALPTTVPIKGADKPGVWLVKKDFEYLQQLREAVLAAEKIVIIGGGFIGVEFAEDIGNLEGKKITVIERLDNLLFTTMDEEFCVAVEMRLQEKGVDIRTATDIKAIVGEEKATAVELADGESIPADLVIVSIGAKPSVELLKDTDIKIGDYGGVWVDEYMRTSVNDIFAVGDYAETRDFFTSKHVPVMLASTGATESRIAASSLYKIRVVRENKGTLGSFCTCIDGMVVGATGLTERRAEAEGFEVVIGEAETVNRHPGSLPGAGQITVKLLFSKLSGVLVGAQVMGPESVSELTNMLALAIQKELSVFEFDTLQIATHPLLTSAPTSYPLISAAQQVLIEMEHLNDQNDQQES